MADQQEIPLPRLNKQDIENALRDALPTIFEYRITGRRGQQGSQKSIKQMRLLIDIAIPRTKKPKKKESEDEELINEGTRELTEDAIVKLIDMINSIIVVQQYGEEVIDPNDTVYFPFANWLGEFIEFDIDSEEATAFLTVFGSARGVRYYRFKNKIYALPLILRPPGMQEGTPPEGVLELFIDTIIPNTYAVDPVEIPDNTTRRRQINEIRRNRATAARLKPIARSAPPPANDENINIMGEEDEIKEVLIIEPEQVVQQVVETKLEPEEEFIELEEEQQLRAQLVEAEMFAIRQRPVRSMVGIAGISGGDFGDFDIDIAADRRDDDDIIDRQFHDEINEGRRQMLNDSRIYDPIINFLTAVSREALSLYRGRLYPVLPNMAQQILDTAQIVSTDLFQTTLRSIISMIESFVTAELPAYTIYAATTNSRTLAVYIAAKSYVLAMANRILVATGYTESFFKFSPKLIVERIVRYDYSQFSESADEEVPEYDTIREGYIESAQITVDSLTDKSLYEYFQGAEVEPPINREPQVESELLNVELYDSIFNSVTKYLGFTSEEITYNTPSYRVLPSESVNIGLDILNSDLNDRDKLDKFFEYLTKEQRSDIDNYTDLYKNVVMQELPDGELYIGTPSGLVYVASTMIYWLLYPFQLALNSVLSGSVIAIGLALCLVSYEIFYIFKLVGVEPPALTTKYSDFCKNIKDAGLYVAEKALDAINTGFATFGYGGMLLIAGLITAGIAYYSYKK